MSVDALRKVIDDTSGSTVNLAMEAINTNNSNNPASHVRMRRDVGDRLKYTLDPTNMLYAGNVFRTTELINECFELMGEDIMYAHYDN